jgi:dihydroneopterin aldolase
MDLRRIILEQLTVQASIGILDHELNARQPLVLNAEFDTLISQAASDTDIQTVLDYRELRDALIEECTRGHINLLETLVDNILSRILREFPSVRHVKIRVSKPRAFEDCAAVSIEQSRAR